MESYDSDLEADDTRWVHIAHRALDRLMELSSLEELRALRVSVDFDHPQELERALESLKQIIQRNALQLCLLQVKYKPTTLTAEARALHEAFARDYSEVSTYLPLCLPPSPLGDQVQWSSPEACEQCIFFEARRCGGLTGEEWSSAPQARGELAGGALSPTWPSEWPLAFSRDDIMGDPPVCYWWPSPPLMKRMGGLLGAYNISQLWDIGGGNGFLSWLFKRSCATLNESLNVDPVAEIYPQPEGVLSLPVTAEEGLARIRSGQLTSPDAVLVSWPTMGESYREILRELNPRVIIRATDEEGVCGVRRGHRALVIKGGSASVFALAESMESIQGEDPLRLTTYDDLEPPLGYQLILSESVWGYRDVKRGLTSPSGRVVVFAQRPLKDREPS